MKILLASLVLVLCAGCRFRSASAGGDGGVFGLRYTGVFTKRGPVFQRLAVNDATLAKFASTPAISNMDPQTGIRIDMKTRVISIDVEKEVECHIAVQKICDQQLEEGYKLAGSFVVSEVQRQITTPPGPRLYLIFQPITL